MKNLWVVRRGMPTNELKCTPNSLFGVIPKPPLGLFAKKQAAMRMLKFDNFGSSGIVETMAGDQNESFAIRSHFVNANQTKCATVC